MSGAGIIAREDERYRGWLIEENWLHEWEATHPSFDGPEDNRYVIAKTRAAVIEEIDTWIEGHS